MVDQKQGTNLANNSLINSSDDRPPSDAVESFENSHFLKDSGKEVIEDNVYESRDTFGDIAGREEQQKEKSNVRRGTGYISS